MRPVSCRFAVVALAGSLLAACGGGYTVVDFRTDGGQYSTSYVRHASTSGGMHVEIHNNPYADREGERLAETVTASLKRSSSEVHDVRFATTPPEGGAAYRMAVLFNPAPGARIEKLCANAEQPTQAPSGDRVNVGVAFCDADEAIRWTRAHRVQPGGAEGAGMRDLFRTVGRELFEPSSDDAGPLPSGGAGII